MLSIRALWEVARLLTTFSGSMRPCLDHCYTDLYTN